MTRLGALKVRGPFRGGTGYDYHTRSFVRAFLALGIAVELEECEWWSAPLPSPLQDALFAELSTPVGARVQVQFVMPHQVVVTPGLATANYTMFEATPVPRDWERVALRLPVTIVPSRSSWNAWAASGVPTDRLRVCPLGVRPGLDDPDVRPLPVFDRLGRPVAEYTYRFLNVAEVIARKNLLGILETWMRATSPDDDAVLILKVNRFRPGAWEMFQVDLAEACKRMRTTLAQAAPIVLVTEYLHDEQMPSLYKAATHYVSLSFGEGWDLPMTEAAAAGLDLIAPQHSAYLDYLDDQTAHLVPRVEVVVDPARGRLAQVDAVLFAGANWWAPDHDEAAAVLRDVIDGRAPAKTSPQRRMVEEFSWENVSRRLVAILREL
ncbi:MAG: glycosyltransferase [Actinomycetota bacterium]|nr:glycosyltransferase [Actinomycetota bacterium]